MALATASLTPPIAVAAAQSSCLGAPWLELAPVYKTGRLFEVGHELRHVRSSADLVHVSACLFPSALQTSDLQISRKFAFECTRASAAREICIREELGSRISSIDTSWQ
eukprot:1056189-Amphidinium_carterae.1